MAALVECPTPQPAAPYTPIRPAALCPPPQGFAGEQPLPPVPGFGWLFQRSHSTHLVVYRRPSSQPVSQEVSVALSERGEGLAYGLSRSPTLPCRCPS